MVKNSLQILFKYKDLLFNLTSKDITIKYRRSVLGVLWSVLNPLLMMCVITLVFSTMFKQQTLINGKPVPFPLYYLLGYVLFNFVAEGTSYAMSSIISSGPLIKKVYIPKYIFPLEKCMFSFVNMLFSLIAAAAVFIFYLLMGKTSLYASMLLFPLPLIYTFIFTVGFSLLLASLAPFFRDLLHLYTVFLTAWTYLTPIFYPIDLIHEQYRRFFKLNPLYHFIDYFRNIMLAGKIPGLKENLICLAFGVVIFAIGVAVFRKNQNKFVLYV